MTALTITEIQLGSNVDFENVLFGEAASLGDVVYKTVDTSGEERWRVAKVDGTAEEAGSRELGVLIHGVPGAGFHGAVIKSGLIYVTSPPTDGVVYILGPGAGEISPESDFLLSPPPPPPPPFAQNDYKTIVGVGGETLGSGAELLIQFFASAEKKP